MNIPRPALLACTLLLAAAPAQVSWTRQTLPTVPAKRSNYDIAWFGGNDYILFGGEGTSYLADTWKWDGKSWTQLQPATSPPRRVGHAMAFDLIRKKVVLFSGWNGGQYIPDTWEFDGTTWTKMAPTNQPPPRDWAAMAFDLRLRQVVLFGGHDYRQTTTQYSYNDTWTWDGTNWTQVKTATTPSHRWGHRLVHDPNLGGVVMVGGPAGDMWRFTGTDWQAVKPAVLPPARHVPAVAFDSFRGVLVLHGGGTQSKPFADTWEWNGKAWTQRLTTGGSGASWVPAFYDYASRRVMTFGGGLGGDRKQPQDGLWAYGPVHMPAFASYGAGCQGTNGTPALTGDHPWTGTNLALGVSRFPIGGSSLLIFGNSKSTWGGLTLPFSLTPLGGTGCSLLTGAQFIRSFLNGTGGATTLLITIPADPALAGATFYLQGLGLDLQANPMGLVASNGLQLKVGAP